MDEFPDPPSPLGLVIYGEIKRKLSGVTIFIDLFINYVLDPTMLMIALSQLHKFEPRIPAFGWWFCFWAVFAVSTFKGGIQQVWVRAADQEEDI